ncbi:glycosyltransferase family 2 protein [Candidatus Bathyarchaeota archaeon]|nr:glycosyltransferase family 2 protein [Candidatus Bathyarchaeota archaeon]
MPSNEMKIAIHCLMKNVYKPYLQEWLDHHRSIGVDHFFLFDNDSEVPLSETIKDIPNSDISIELAHGKALPSLNIQMASYDHFLSAIQEATLPHYDRVAFIDEDEFIICANNNLKATLNDYLGYPAISLSWKMFGSSGLLTRTPEPQMKKFTKYTGIYYRGNVNIKCIVNPYLVKKAVDPHSFTYHMGTCVNTHKIPIEGHYSCAVHEIAWINHYWTRSLEEWKLKAERGSPNNGQKRDLTMFDELNYNCTETIA